MKMKLLLLLSIFKLLKLLIDSYGLIHIHILIHRIRCVLKFCKLKMRFIHVVSVLVSSAAICYGIEDALQNATTQMLSMPLQNNINAPIFAHIDIGSVNKELKAFIQQEVENGIKTAMANLADGIIKKKLDAITPQLEAHLQQKLEQATAELQCLLSNYLCTLTKK